MTWALWLLVLHPWLVAGIVWRASTVSEELPLL